MKVKPAKKFAIICLTIFLLFDVSTAFARGGGGGSSRAGGQSSSGWGDAQPESRPGRHRETQEHREQIQQNNRNEQQNTYQYEEREQTRSLEKNQLNQGQK